MTDLRATAYCYTCGVLQTIEDRTFAPVPGHNEIRHVRVQLHCGHTSTVVVAS